MHLGACGGGLALHCRGRVACARAFIPLASGTAVSSVVFIIFERCGAGANGGHGALRGQDARGAVWGAPGKWGAWCLGASVRIYCPSPSTGVPTKSAFSGARSRRVTGHRPELSPPMDLGAVVLQPAPTWPWALPNASWGPRVLSFLSDTAILTVHLEVSWRVPRGPSL